MQGIGGALGDAIPSCFWTKAEARMAEVPKSTKDSKKRFESAYPLLCFSLSLDPCINGDKGFLVVFNFRHLFSRQAITADCVPECHLAFSEDLKTLKVREI